MNRDPRPPHGAPLETEYRPRHPLDFRRTVLFLRRGRGDPTMTVDGPVVWRASRTPAGLATLALRESGAGVIKAAAWGNGAGWALAQLPALCGADDDSDGFDASLHPLVADAHHQNPGLRLARTEIVFDALACAIFEQKVTGMQAFGAWRRILTWFGERAPGPTPHPMFAPPTIEGWRHIPSWAWHRAGLEPSQSRTVVAAARRGDALTRATTAAHTGPERDQVLTSIRGVGPWTSAETRIRALGDTDAVSVGDYHLAHEVGNALAGSRTDDDGMLELLAPWSGQRQRVIRLIGASGVREQRRGPKLHPEDHRAR
ncbi:3-methyladenine DNA glycosylase/8-oxoguanine DNA glycosylase [Microbacterium endophyticum]|uniref:3-methyladenine DNA glycosylase/8-oxoguanine DNA glycosylase n=1 Tax=Microbacterium endophyticum TaxID=1526412 RepID=A0A7W4V450_9MICO|nr:DNA-3-methyladenine glycosylase 2 family protein [Microbacterium endophyticum]MBB2975950.1 3-methyladenine DNA glycosylase/8-oxoguanine DNA glycosylase [Microbacterium endophyticum]NIK37681.1 3-methyladenine DNA glycosylase/8-oxoguanine DNA glycosylase [Microbacterium endophyticum]